MQASGYMVNNVESRKDSNKLIYKTGRGPALVISQIGFLLIVFIFVAVYPSVMEKVFAISEF